MTRVTLLQMSAQDGIDLEQSFAAVTEAITHAGEADLYLLPELWTPGYFAFDDYERAAETFDVVTTFLSDLARKSRAYVHGGSLLEEREGELFNCSILFDRSGQLIAQYRKIHLFGYGSREQELLTPGERTTVVDTDFGRVGLAVCYDLRFPEQFRLMTDSGAEGFLVASAWPHPRIEAWNTLLRARAIENQAYMLAANGVGMATGGVLCGRSAIIDPWGVTVASAGDLVGSVSSDIDFDEVTTARRIFPALADRRVLPQSVPTLLFERANEAPLSFEVKRVLLAGYTARDEAAVRRYIAKLEDEGIPPPEEVPTFFVVGSELVTTATSIDVVGDETCGEVEFALLIADDGEVYVAAASDHTDRALEQTSIPAAKQACPKPMSRQVWRLSNVHSHWDELVMRSFTPAESEGPYQEAEAKTLIHPDNLLALVKSRFGDDLGGTIVLGGSFSSQSGSFNFATSFRAEIHDPVTDEKLVAEYRVANVLEKED
jgi:predicted amidohydrolase